MIEKKQVEVPVSEFVRDCVNIPLFSSRCAACGSYEKSWSCPPFSFKPLELWGNYETLLLKSVKIPIPSQQREQQLSQEELASIGHDLLHTEKHALLLELLEMEKHYPGSMALSAGSCNICPPGSCTRIKQEPCRNPEMMRYSIEALGGDVGKALKTYLGQTLLWSENGYLPEYYILLGGLLKKRTASLQAKEMGYRVW